MKKERVSILGCGWLGTSIAERLLTDGYSVKGSVRREEAMKGLTAKGIEAYQLVLGHSVEGEDLDAFFDADTLILSFPPVRREDIEEFLSAQFQALIERSIEAGVRNILMISSTSTLPSVNRSVDEEDVAKPESRNGRALLKAERLLLQEPRLNTSVLRFGGLVGKDRFPKKVLEKGRSMGDPKKPLNLIHLVDCVEIVSRILAKGKWGWTFNACADEHPSRRSFYKKAAKSLGMAPPAFDGNAPFGSYKFVSNERLKRELSYRFIYPDPLGMPLK